MKIPFVAKTEPEHAEVRSADHDRAAGEDAIANIEGELSEAAPAGIPQLKTERL